jgi:hypothetical protein
MSLVRETDEAGSALPSRTDDHGTGGPSRIDEKGTLSYSLDSCLRSPEGRRSQRTVIIGRLLQIGHTLRHFRKLEGVRAGFMCYPQELSHSFESPGELIRWPLAPRSDNRCT